MVVVVMGAVGGKSAPISIPCRLSTVKLNYCASCHMSELRVNIDIVGTFTARQLQFKCRNLHCVTSNFTFRLYYSFITARQTQYMWI